MGKKKYEHPQIISLSQDVSGWPECLDGSGGLTGGCTNGVQDRLKCAPGDGGDWPNSCNQGVAYGLDTCSPGNSPDLCMGGLNGSHNYCNTGSSVPGNCMPSGNGVGAPADCSCGTYYGGVCTLGNNAGTACVQGGYVVK